MASFSKQSTNGQASQPHSPVIHSRSNVRKNDLGVSPVTQWRWEQAGIIPSPDIEINGRQYYSDEGRQAVITAVLNNRKECA